ncbi:unnamed protein product [Gongylonema pulchrum]|uniref:Uncharacterized protein n=1 Tax=Gongylonema pulchrum TaxID=637853 RepID=A0A183DLW3_9BILA|nr:unnamed protein product [Gongylonema pulchrum]
MAIVPQQAFPLNETAFPLGSLTQKTLNFDSKRRIPVIELSILDCTAEELNALLREAWKRRRFGSMYATKLVQTISNPSS